MGARTMLLKMEPRPRHSCVRRIARSPPFSRWPVLWSGVDVGRETKTAQPLQLDILINGEKTGLLGSFLQLPNGNIASRRSELIEAGVEVPGSGQPDEIVDSQRPAGR